MTRWSTPLVLPFRPVPPSHDGRYASNQWALVDRPPSLQQIGLLRSNRRLLAGVPQRISVAAARAHRSALARARRSRGPSNLSGRRTRGGSARPDSISAKELLSGLRPSGSEALDRHRQVVPLCTIRSFRSLAEPTLPSLPAAKRPSVSDLRNIGAVQAPITDLLPRGR